MQFTFTVAQIAKAPIPNLPETYLMYIFCCCLLRKQQLKVEKLQKVKRQNIGNTDRYLFS